MQAAIVAMNEKRGENTEPIRIGIGLNTGACVVGNVGSPQRFDYSVLGDVVNTASRIEEMTKTYGTPIIIGEKTAAAAADFAIVEITTTALRGKDRGEKLFALVGDETAARHPRWEDLKRHVLDFAEAMATKDMPAARRHIVAARALGVIESGPLLEAAEQRLPL
jgi:adenylate cyclase